MSQISCPLCPSDLAVLLRAKSKATSLASAGTWPHTPAPEQPSSSKQDPAHILRRTALAVLASEVSRRSSSRHLLSHVRTCAELEELAQCHRSWRCKLSARSEKRHGMLTEARAMSRASFCSVQQRNWCKSCSRGSLLAKRPQKLHRDCASIARQPATSRKAGSVLAGCLSLKIRLLKIEVKKSLCICDKLYSGHALRGEGPASG